MVVMLFSVFFLLLLLCSSHPGPCLQQINPSSSDSPPPQGGVSKVKRRPAGLNRCTARAFPPGRSVHLAADQKMMAKASRLPSFHPSFFLSPSTCVRASSPVPPVDPSWASLSWLVGSSDKHTRRKYKCTPVPPCVTRQMVLRAGGLWGGGVWVGEDGTNYA